MKWNKKDNKKNEKKKLSKLNFMNHYACTHTYALEASLNSLEEHEKNQSEVRSNNSKIFSEAEISLHF